MIHEAKTHPTVWRHKDFEAKGQLYHVGVRFEAFCKRVLTTALDFSCNFFLILTSGFEQCGGPSRKS